MRGFFWLWVMILLLCLVTDSGVYWVTRSRLGVGLELALDAALISGVNENDLIHGRQTAYSDRAEVWANEILIKNLPQRLARDASFSFELTQKNDRIWVSGQVKAAVPFLLGALAGKGSREITVSKVLHYQGGYK